MPSTRKARVAAYFTALVNASPKTQDQIAEDAGFVSTNTISMIKTGRTKIPLWRIPMLANALDSDPKEMLAIALQAYQPELYNVFAALTPSMLISNEELRLIHAVRSAARRWNIK